MWVACSSEKGVFSRSSDTPLPLVVLIVDTRLTTICIIPPRSLKYDYVGGANANLESHYDLSPENLWTKLACTKEGNTLISLLKMINSAP